jgi:glycosyl-4,4'-diaponeurosporenoate acyltransferase
MSEKIFLLPLNQLFLTAIIFIVMGSVFFIVGEMLPRKNLDYTTFPFRAFRWEQDGKIYQKIGIHKWKDRLPDMSKHIRKMFAKKISAPRSPEYTHRLILETCIAELIHTALILFSPIFRRHLIGIYGEIAMLLYILGNLPFILIQRYNRPRLIMLMEKQRLSRRRQKNTECSSAAVSENAL